MDQPTRRRFLRAAAAGTAAGLAGCTLPGGVDRSYITEQQGIVHAYEDGGLPEAPFLDLRGVVEAGGGKGLLGIALHPEFGDDRRVFVRYSAPRREGTPSARARRVAFGRVLVGTDTARWRRVRHCSRLPAGTTLSALCHHLIRLSSKRRNNGRIPTMSPPHAVPATSHARRTAALATALEPEPEVATHGRGR